MDMSVKIFSKEYNCSRFMDRKTTAIYKLYKSTDYCDITLIAEEDGTKIPCHRIVLAASTDYFATMFTSNFIEAQSKNITIKDISGKDLEALVEFAYTGKININEENVYTLFFQASLLLYNDVVNCCTDFLENLIEASNCISLELFASRYDCTDLEKVARDYQKKNILDVLKYDEYLQLDTEKVSELFLDREDVEEDREEKVFEGLMKWINYDRINRECNLPKLISTIRLSLLDDEFLLDDVLKAVHNYEECINLVLATIRCKPTRLVIVVNFEIHIYNLDNKTFKRTYLYNDLSGHRIAINGNNLMMVGLGRENDEVKCLHLRSGNWKILPSIANSRFMCSVSFLNKNLYVIGGARNAMRTAERFDDVKKKWFSLADMHNGRCGHSCDVFNEKIYVAGGFNSSNKCIDKVECYDPKTNSWLQCGSMVQKRAFAPLIATKDNLFVFSGWSGINTYLQCIEKYDPGTDTWTKVADLTKKFIRLDATLVNDKVILVGAHAGEDNIVLEEFDTLTNKCRILTKLKPLQLQHSDPIFLFKL